MSGRCSSLLQSVTKKTSARRVSRGLRGRPGKTARTGRPAPMERFQCPAIHLQGSWQAYQDGLGTVDQYDESLDPNCLACPLGPPGEPGRPGPKGLSGSRVRKASRQELRKERAADRGDPASPLKRTTTGGLGRRASRAPPASRGSRAGKGPLASPARKASEQSRGPAGCPDPADPSGTSVSLSSHPN